MSVDPREGEPAEDAIAFVDPKGVHTAPMVLGRGIDASIVVALAFAVVVVHPLRYLWHQPYWFDESWVAVLSRAPLSRWVSLSSSTPLGWLLLVRLVPSGGALRIVPLVFAVGDVVAAYWLARSVPWKNDATARCAGTVTAVIVLLAPISLVRQDLKQYTADAFFALVLVTLVIRFEGKPSRRTFATFGVVAVAAIPISSTSAFVTIAALVAIAVTALVTRSRDQLRTVAVGSAAMMMAIAGYALLVVLPHDNKALRAFWRTSYLTGNVPRMLADAWHRLERLQSGLGMPAFVFIILVACGVAMVAALRRPAAALSVPLLWGEMFLLGAARRYPFLDQRTSHFLLVLSLAFVGIGVTGLLDATFKRSRTAGLVLACIGGIVLLQLALPSVWNHSIPNEDGRSEVQYVARHRANHDVILVSAPSAYAFAYYWPGAKVSYAVDHSNTNATGFLARVRNVSDVFYAHGRTQADIVSAFHHVLRLAATQADTHIWIIRTHLTAGEADAWTAAMQSLALRPESLPIGPEPLLRIDPHR